MTPETNIDDLFEEWREETKFYSCTDVLMKRFAQFVLSKLDVSQGGEWVACSERLPEQGTRCLVFNGIAVEPAVYDRNEFYRYPSEITGDRVTLYHFDKSKCTHWMPLPQIPQP